MFPELSLCVNGQESEHSFSVNAYESEYSKIDESGNIYESGKISASVNLVWVLRLLKGSGEEGTLSPKKPDTQAMDTVHHI